MLPDGLSMLWEPVEATPALSERFGFDGLDAVAAWVSGVLDETWGIGVLGCDRVVISGRNAIVWTATDTATSRGALVVKLSRDESRFAALEASARLLGHLGRRGLPVAAPVPARTGAERATVAGPVGPVSVAVQPEIAGDWLDVADGAAVRAAGACLARLHHELRDQTDERLPTRPRIPVSRAVLEDWLTGQARGLAPAASSHLSRLLAGLPELDQPAQLVHSDYRAANILTRGPAVVGVLDFDELAVGQPVGDLAYASVYLATLFTDWRPTSATAREQLRAGYESVRPLSTTEGLWYDALVLWLGIQAIPGEADPAGWAAAVS